MAGDENEDFPSHRRYIVIYLTREVNLSLRSGIMGNDEDLTLHVASVEGNRQGPCRPLCTGNEETIVIIRPRKFRVVWSNWCNVSSCHL